MAILEWNTSGDRAIRFTREAPEDTPCNVTAAASYSIEGVRGGFFVLEGSSGAAFIQSRSQDTHAGPLVLDSVTNHELYVRRVEIGGVSWGSTPFTVAVEGMTWWDNDLLSNATLRVTVSCEEDFQIVDLQGSDTAEILTPADFAGGLGADQAKVSVADSVSRMAQGTTPYLIGFVLSTGSPPSASLTIKNGGKDTPWTTISDDEQRFLFSPLQPGTVSIDLLEASGILVLVLADMPPHGD